MEEIWKSVNIPGFEHIYEISNKGRLRSIDRYILYKDGVLRFCRGRIRSPKIDKDGYEVTNLYNKENRKHISIHRIVALTFIENDQPDIKTQVNHKDENKRNNNVENLEWCTPQYNHDYGTHNQKTAEGNRGKIISEAQRKHQSEIMKGRKLSKETIKKIADKHKIKVLCVETGEIFDSLKEAEKKYGSRVGQVTSGKRETFKNMHFKKIT